MALRGITVSLPVPEGPQDHTADYIDLYSISCALDPEQSESKPGQWEEDYLERLDAYQPKHDGIALSKANLGLIGYRRLRLANPNLAPHVIERIIKIGTDGLAAARRMAEQGMPWWHVANVPFQVVCVFLAMDGRESLSHISEAMRTLEFVVQRFRTTAMREALKTARFLVRLSKKRKDEDSNILASTLQKCPAEFQSRLPSVDRDSPRPAPVLNGSVLIPAEENPMTASAASSEDWNLDALNDSQFDWYVSRWEIDPMMRMVADIRAQELLPYRRHACLLDLRSRRFHVEAQLRHDLR